MSEERDEQDHANMVQVRRDMMQLAGEWHNRGYDPIQCVVAMAAWLADQASMQDNPKESLEMLFGAMRKFACRDKKGMAVRELKQALAEELKALDEKFEADDVPDDKADPFEKG